jgi:hypothetical protein
MQRRKFLIGVGSLAAGTAAAMSSGAVDSARLEDRTANVQIAVTDYDALLSLRDADNSDEVDVSYDSRGRMVLEFKDYDGNSPSQVDTNIDGVFNFHNVFGVWNRGGDPLDVWVEIENMPAGSNGGDGDNWVYAGPLGDAANATDPSVRSNPSNLLRVNAGSTGNFGVHLDTRGTAPGEDIMLEMTIHAEEV